MVFAILATLVPSLGLGVMAFRHYQNVVDEKVAHELRALAGHARRELDLWTQERVHDVRSLSTSTVVIDGLAAARGHPATGDGSPALALYLRAVQARLPPLLELTVVASDGHIVASSAATPTPVRPPEVWPQNAVTAGVILAPPHWDTTRSAPVITVAVPVLSIGNEILGTLAALLDLRAVELQTQERGLPAGEVILLDAQGRPLTGTFPDAQERTPLQADTLLRLLAQRSPPVAFRSFAGREVLGVAEISQARGVILLAQQDRAAVTATWHGLRNQLLMLIGGLSLLVGLLAYRMGRAIVTPLRRLTGAAERIAGGDLGVQLPTTRDDDEIGRLSQAFNLMTDGLRRSRADIDAANQALQQQNRLLERLSVTDALTGLYNRKKLNEILTDQIARYRRNGRGFSVLMLDIDHFKSLNDHHGHLLGDQVLAQVADILVRTIRNVDSAARYGGEEFVIVLTETGSNDALETAERIRARVAEARYGTGEQRIAVTLSIGVAEIGADDADAEAVIARADRALYQAKDAGRNRVVSATEG